MRAGIAVLSVFLMAVQALADPATGSRRVDLRDADALQELRKSNPAHFDKITEIVVALTLDPQLVERGWLQTRFEARNVDSSFIQTSNPPRQIVQFTLGDTRYTLSLTRSDMVVELMPAVSRQP